MIARPNDGLVIPSSGVSNESARLATLARIRRSGGAADATLLLSGRENLIAQSSRPARSYRYIHLDVFTDRRLAGNQLLVYVNPEGLDAAAMTRLTRESNYSENTFVFPAEQPGTDFRVPL